MKATKKIAMIVLFVLVCYTPLRLINFVNMIFDSPIKNNIAIKAAIILTHLNPAVNPYLYAYHLKDFRVTFKRILRIKNQKETLSLALGDSSRNKRDTYPNGNA